MIPIDKAVYEKVLSLGEGSFKCGWLFGGWINIEFEQDLYKIMWTSGKERHQPLDGPAYMVDMVGEYFNNFYNSALSMWPVNDPEEQESITRYLSRKIMKARKRS